MVVAVIALAPLPYTNPVRVEAPVPPSATAKSVIPVIVPPVILAFEDQKVGRVAYVVEALVAVKLVIVPVVPQKVGNVAYVVEALVIVPLVANNRVPVALVKFNSGKV